jgi:hypothetical protein
MNRCVFFAGAAPISVISAVTVLFTTQTPVARAADTTDMRISKIDDYPHKPIRTIDPFASAGASDVMGAVSGTEA